MPLGSNVWSWGSPPPASRRVAALVGAGLDERVVSHMEEAEVDEMWLRLGLGAPTDAAAATGSGASAGRESGGGGGGGGGGAHGMVPMAQVRAALVKHGLETHMLALLSADELLDVTLTLTLTLTLTVSLAL